MTKEQKLLGDKIRSQGRCQKRGEGWKERITIETTHSHCHLFQLSHGVEV